MNDKEKQKLKAGATMVVGGFRCVSAAALITGHGVLAAFARKPITRARLATILMKSGQETFEKGLRDWKACS